MGCTSSKTSGETPAASKPQAAPAQSEPKKTETSSEPSNNVPAASPSTTQPMATSASGGSGGNIHSGNVTLTYFDIMGAGEVFRMMFALKKVKYEDKRITFEQWPEEKKNTPFGYIPILDVDGFLITETGAMLNYVGLELGLLGKTPQDESRIHEILSYNKNLGPLFRPIFLDTAEEDRPAAFEAIKDKVIEHATRIETKIASRGGDWFLGDEMSAGDLLIHLFMTGSLKFFGESFGEKCPSMTALYKKVGEVPEIAEWNKTRPDTYF